MTKEQEEITSRIKTVIPDITINQMMLLLGELQKQFDNGYDIGYDTGYTVGKESSGCSGSCGKC